MAQFYKTYFVINSLTEWSNARCFILSGSSLVLKYNKMIARFLKSTIYIITQDCNFSKKCYSISLWRIERKKWLYGHFKSFFLLFLKILQIFDFKFGTKISKKTLQEYWKQFLQWKRINHKQSARWQHLSRLRASAFLFEIFLLGVKKHNSLYLR